MTYGIYADLTKNLIFEHVTQEELFYFYTGYNPATQSEPFSSPLRTDRKPSCSYYKAGDKIRMKDFAQPHAGYDCFDIVQQMFHLDFRGALCKIAEDFGIMYNGYLGTIKTRPQLPQLTMRQTQSSTVIQIRAREWETADLKYWNEYGISRETLDLYSVSPVQNVFLNGKIIYHYYGYDKGYAYRLAPYTYKIYFPERSTNKFICNTSKLQGYQQLPPSGDHIVITKSMKDVMLFHEFGISAVAPQGESVIISRKFYDHIITRFKKVYILYDNDMAGKRGTVKTKKLFPDIIACQIPSHYAKDISDFYREFGTLYTRDLINNVQL